MIFFFIISRPALVNWIQDSLHCLVTIDYFCSLLKTRHAG